MRQRDTGEGFVSRTRLFHTQAGESIEVLRAVLANPLTTEADIQAVLAEQLKLGAQLSRKRRACLTFSLSGFYAAHKQPRFM